MLLLRVQVGEEGEEGEEKEVGLHVAAGRASGVEHVGLAGVLGVGVVAASEGAVFEVVAGAEEDEPTDGWKVRAKRCKTMPQMDGKLKVRQGSFVATRIKRCQLICRTLLRLDSGAT